MRRHSTESGADPALAAATLARHAPATLVVLCPHGDDVDDLIDDLPFFRHSRRTVSGLGNAPLGASDMRRGFRRPLAGVESAAIVLSGWCHPGGRGSCRAAGDAARIRLSYGSAGTSPSRYLCAAENRRRRHSKPVAARAQTRNACPTDAYSAGGRGNSRRGVVPVAGRERFSEYAGGGIARRVFAPRRHHGHFRPRLVRSGAGGVLRRRDRIDPPVRGRQPAEPRNAGRN